MRDRIMASAREMILKQGVKGFTMDDISHDLGISKKTVYKFFTGKNELISCIVDSHIENDRAATAAAVEREDTPVGKLNSVINNYYNYKVPLRLVDELKKSFPAEWKKVDELFDYKKQLFRKLFLKAAEEKLVNGDINIDVLMLILDKGIKSILDYDFLAAHDTDSMTANRLLDDLKKIVLHGVLKT